MVQGLSFVLMHVPDVAAARGFYTQKLGFTVDAEQPGFVQFARRSDDDATYALGQTPPHTPAGPELWWYVAGGLHPRLHFNPAKTGAENTLRSLGGQYASIARPMTLSCFR